MKIASLAPGDIVQMNSAYKSKLSHSLEHLQEFGDCIGIVEGPLDYGNGHLGPEYDVRWYPSFLRYGYLPEDLDLLGNIDNTFLEIMEARNIKNIKRKFSIANNESADICSKCNGNCCKGMPGSMLPQEFGDSEKEIEDNLFEALKTNYAIDWWEGDPTGKDEFSDLQAFFIRPRTKKAKHRIVDSSWGGECVFFESGKGCSLTFDKRPSECKALIPVKTDKPGIKCYSSDKKLSKQGSAIAWIDKHEIIQRAHERAKDALRKA